MPNTQLAILFDQNVPLPVAVWLRNKCPGWTIVHVNDLGFQGRPDSFLFKWAQDHSAIVITFDEDFADSRLYAYGKNPGVIRLRTWPTTVELSINALERLFDCLPTDQWRNALIIIEQRKIRIRPGPQLAP